MPRNSAGVYSLPNPPVVTDTTILSSDENTTRDDLAAEITNSLDRNGRGGMLAPFRIADGLLAAPGLSFLNETSTGLYRSGAGAMSLVVGATAVLSMTASLVTVPISQLSLGTNVLAANPTFSINAAAGRSKQINFLTAGVNRWIMLGADATAESGGNAGSNFQLLARDDAGAAIDTPINITRAAGGQISFNRQLLLLPGLLAFNSTQDGTIFVNTADGADSRALIMCGAGANADTRGGAVAVFGNEHANTGKIRLIPGNVAGGSVELYAASTRVLSISSALAGSGEGALVLNNNLTVGRLGTFDANTLKSFNTFSDTASVEMSAASSPGNRCGISMTGQGATLFKATVRLVVNDVERLKATTTGVDITGALVGDATQDVFNTVSTTVNAFGSATMLRVGATTGGIGWKASALGYVGHRFAGTMTSDGASTAAIGMMYDGAVIGAPGDNSYVTAVLLSPAGITTQTAAEAIGQVATLRLSEPNITLGAGSSIVDACTLYINSQPTEGTNNAGLITAFGVETILRGLTTIHTLAGGVSPALPAQVGFVVRRNDITTRQAAIALIAGSAERASLYFGDDASATVGEIFYNNSNNAMALVTNGTVRMTLDGTSIVGTVAADFQQTLNVRGGSSSGIAGKFSVYGTVDGELLTSFRQTAAGTQRALFVRVTNSTGIVQLDASGAGSGTLAFASGGVDQVRILNSAGPNILTLTGGTNPTIGVTAGIVRVAAGMRIDSLAGAGTRTVVAAADGTISAP